MGPAAYRTYRRLSVHPISAPRGGGHQPASEKRWS